MSDAELTFAWAATFVDVLHRAGVRHVVVCPGSRSAPLALAFSAQGAIRVWPVPDERSAAFFALGIGMASGTAAALVVTSGTAGANAHPAVIEAALSQVPLIVVTANRPAELHGFGALQTIDQHRLFGVHARFVGLPVPERALFPHLRATVGRALALPGVVHFDVPFREPLAPPVGAVLPGPVVGSEQFAVGTPSDVNVERAADLLAGRTAIVAGPGQPSEAMAEAVRQLSERLSAPVLAEAASGLRFGAHSAHCVAHYDALWRVEALRAELQPEVVIRIGGPLTTRTLQGFVDGCRTVVALAAPGRVCDPNHSATVVLEGDPERMVRALATRVSRHDGAYLRRWLMLDERALAAVERVEGEPALARALVAALPSGAQLMLSNSMPIRDVDAFASRSSRHLGVFSSRGASGIDGINSTAFGIAAGSGKKTALLVGDTAFLHDVGGLLWGARLGVPLAMVVVNNGGGRIFDFLPVAQSAARFEELFIMPPRVALEPLAQAAQVSYQRAAGTDGLAAWVGQALEGGTHLLEVDLTGRDSVADHARAWAAVKEAAA